MIYNEIYNFCKALSIFNLYLNNNAIMKNVTTPISIATKYGRK